MKEPENQTDPHQNEELKDIPDSSDPIQRSCQNCVFHSKKEFPLGSECKVFAIKKELMDKETAVKFKGRERIEDPRVKFHIYARFNQLDNWPYEYIWGWISDCELYEEKQDSEEN